MSTLTNQKRNELMHILAHQRPEFSQVLAAGAEVSKNNRNYFYKKISGKRDQLAKRIDLLWNNLYGETEATFRYDLFLNRNEDFPMYFQTDSFKNAFTFTRILDSGVGILGHHTSPLMFYIQARSNYVQDKQNQFRKENPNASQEDLDKERMKYMSEFSSEYELGYFNSILNALSKPLPDVYVKALDAVTKGRYSAKQIQGGSRRKTRRRRY